MGENLKESSYEQYKELGGIINEQDYESALTRATSSVVDAGEALVKQAELMAKSAGILFDSNGDPDLRIKLYVTLRTDTKPKNVAHHHSQMSDQRLFAEALRMLGDAVSLQKLITAYPNIIFY